MREHGEAGRDRQQYLSMKGSYSKQQTKRESPRWNRYRAFALVCCSSITFREHRPAQPNYTLHQVCIAEESNALAGLDLGDGLAEFDQPVGVCQRRQQTRALAREFDRFERAVTGLAQGDADIFAAADLLLVAEGGANRHRDEIRS